MVAAPDERWGEVPVAFLVVEGPEPDPDDLAAHLRERIARFKVPRRFEFVAELPKTGTGKIQKFVLRQRTPQS